MNKEEKKIIRRSTSQRDLVLEAVRTGNHLSAREIFVLVSQKKPMSFGTVYRNLQILAEAGEIIAIPNDPTLLRYDSQSYHHHHLHCRKCGRIFDMPLTYRDEFDKEAAEKSGFVIDSHSISFEGLCHDCQDEQ
ncbi:MAG: transcriptional repressor [Spirochaetaceae bacterium]|jgi:Fe2+ or Zn2+ uptake regulation protein|nr:transcriptional repressor [Spirochaetaceae bacterium]